MKLPSDRGPISAAVLELLRNAAPGPEAAEVGALDSAMGSLRGDRTPDADLLTDEDVQLSLWVLYELHYLGFEGVDPDWEWDPALLAARRQLEARFEADLRRRTAAHVATALEAPGDVAQRLFDLTDTFEGPSLSRYLHREATAEQFLEFLTQRSIYHLKESDPHSWVIPRISGKPKVALVEVQYDEYGAGRPARLHSTMFGDTLEAVGLDRRYGAYVDVVPAYTLAVNNAMSLFGLHRRLRAAGMGHLGAFEATSSLPCRRYAGGIRRLGLPEKAAEYFDEHIEADAVHEQLAFRDICAELVRQDPSLEQDVFLGTATCLLLDAVASGHMLAAWEAGRSTLRGQAPEAVAS